MGRSGLLLSTSVDVRCGCQNGSLQLLRDPLGELVDDLRYNSLGVFILQCFDEGVPDLRVRLSGVRGTGPADGRSIFARWVATIVIGLSYALWSVAMGPADQGEPTRTRLAVDPQLGKLR
ncbi:hypothetical protein [Streptomyces auratus]|uniref:Uncharacterized protein n=1 Tax=Streptomyces auratus AGR0001 TaxID=1160718 RepID=J1RLT3_9ACTN|nr:hypothetical protein [Streptomyces auratus]QTZ92196.1 hypothetical protein SU9_012500 [Streptomyces auratus AGR0001]